MLETFQALAEPNRLQIVDLLLNGPLTVGAVAQRLGIRQPQASKHLKMLSDSGLVEIRPDAQRRVCALRVQPLRDLDLWLGRYRQLWEEQFERLDEVLAEIQKETAPRALRKAKAKPRLGKKTI